MQKETREKLVAANNNAWKNEREEKKTEAAEIESDGHIRRLVVVAGAECAANN